MSQPLVSIVIPSWNHLPELLVCLESIAAQTYRSIEVIVVDDGSTDGTAARMSEYKMLYPFKVHLFPENRGAAAARNAGAALAEGAYLLFVDADAELRPDAVEVMASVLTAQPEATFVYSSFRFGWKTFASRTFDAHALRNAPYIHTTGLMRRAAFPGFDESLKKFQDWDLWLTIVEHGGKGIWIPRELFVIKTRTEGMSHWLPSFVYRIPWPLFGWTPKEIIRYREWESVIKKKHHIPSHA